MKKWPAGHFFIFFLGLSCSAFLFKKSLFHRSSATYAGAASILRRADKPTELEALGICFFPVLFSSFCFPRLQGVTDQIELFFFGVSVKDWEIWHIGDKRWFSLSLVPQALGCLRLSLSLSSVSGIYCLRNNGFLNHGDRSIGTTGRCIVSTRYWLQRTQSPTRPRPFISKL